MKMFFTDYTEAYNAACDYARSTHHDVTIRKTKQYSTPGYSIGLTGGNRGGSRPDDGYGWAREQTTGDYAAHADIVTPRTPLMSR